MAEIVVTELRPADRERWAELWRGYLDFYETTLPEAIYDETWRRLMTPGPIFGFGARLGDAAAPLVGITHYLFHDHAWSPKQVCYLQDLFVDAKLRGTGCGRALIERVGQVARARLPAALLDNQGRQRHGPAALRPARQVQWLYPLRLRARLSTDGFCRRSTRLTDWTVDVGWVGPAKPITDARRSRHRRSVPRPCHRWQRCCGQRSRQLTYPSRRESAAAPSFR